MLMMLFVSIANSVPHSTTNGGSSELANVRESFNTESSTFRQAVAEGALHFKSDDMAEIGPGKEAWRNRASKTAILTMRTKRLQPLRYEDVGATVSADDAWENAWQNKLTYASVQG